MTRLLLGDGAGGFTLARKVWRGGNSAAVGDVNLDGNQDVVIGDKNVLAMYAERHELIPDMYHPNILLLGDGKGGFATRALPYTSVKGETRSVALGDVNGMWR